MLTRRCHPHISPASRRVMLIPRSFAAVMLSTVAVVGASTPVSAQEAPAPTVYHACYVPLTGTVYRIKEAGLRTSCSSTSHIEFSWTDGLGALRGTDAAAGDLSGSLSAPLVAGLQGRAVANTAPAAGQVLTFDGTKWEPAATMSSGLVNGSFVATGSLGAGTLPASGNGVRMMWYPGKAAFRAGYAYDDYWDDANVGKYSVAMGSSTKASGDNAVALGAEAIASTYHTTAMGFRTTASAPYSTAMGNYASSNFGGSFVYGDASTFSYVNATASDQFVVRAQHLWFGTNNSVTATAGRFLETSTGAYLSTGGVWTNVSDVNRKHLFEDISSDDILSRLAALPITTWSYKAEDDSVRHLGPTAQDFYAAFHLGSSDTSIGTVDADGVSLAATQALEKRTRELQTENAQLKSRVAALESAVRQLQAASGQH